MPADSHFIPMKLAILTISDSRGPEQDSSGQYLVDQAREAGHQIVSRRLLPDDPYLMRALVSGWIAHQEVQAVIITGGTGFHERDSTPEALLPLFDKIVDGFGEQFRALSYLEIGNSTIQSRAMAGMANHTVVFCLPGSTGACRTGWEGIIRDQLDSRHRPCNFAGLLGRKPAKPVALLSREVPLDALAAGQ
ncbi:MAG: molybdenum cofactor biosynthesis protein B [Halomonadaceae bacterium]|nr:MAG: molybdenum cofactor biosynthesis protein B [Halomonadaceae bacterium]